MNSMLVPQCLMDDCRQHPGMYAASHYLQFSGSLYSEDGYADVILLKLELEESLSVCMSFVFPDNRSFDRRGNCV